jgi:hypothetical protein
MTKRRERDRPKCAPTSLYNPNKRVLLQYDSDDEVEEVDREQQEDVRPLSAIENATADYAIPAYSESDKEDAVKPGAARDQAEQDVEDATSKSSASKRSSKWPRRVEVTGRDMATGQFPALGPAEYSRDEGEEGGEEGESEEDEAMAYLRAVR